MTIELDTTLAQAEVLFVSFAQLVADIDRREAENKSAAAAVLRRRKVTLQSEDAPTPAPATPATDEATVVAPPVPKLSEELRELLKTH
jgi:hypothetical protein